MLERLVLMVHVERFAQAGQDFARHGPDTSTWHATALVQAAAVGIVIVAPALVGSGADLDLYDLELLPAPALAVRDLRALATSFPSLCLKVSRCASKMVQERNSRTRFNHGR